MPKVFIYATAKVIWTFLFYGTETTKTGRMFMSVRLVWWNWARYGWNLKWKWLKKVNLPTSKCRKSLML